MPTHPIPGQPGFVVPAPQDRPRFDRRAVRVLVVDEADRMLLFQDSDLGLDPVAHWWVTPGGGVDPGETPEQAAAREVLEETGWAPGPLTHWTGFHPSNGLSDQRFELFGAEGATRVGEPSDPYESERVEWVPAQEARRHVREGRVRDGLSLTALLWWQQALIR